MFKKYKFRPYDLKFKAQFYREKVKLNKILPANTLVEHVGSSAVPGLGGKGVIDIIIGANKKNILKVKKILIKNGYDFRHFIYKRYFFQKDYSSGGKLRRIHIHLTTSDNYVWLSHIAARDYLRNHPESAKKYAEIKRKAVKIAKGRGRVYQKYKNKFLNDLTRKAIKEWKSKNRKLK